MHQKLRFEDKADLARRSLLLATLAAASGTTLGTACSAREQPPTLDYTLLDGSRGHTAGLLGKVVLVNFWATTCATCVAEMPALVATFEKFKSRGFDTLAVAMRHDPPALVASFAQTRGLPFGVVIDNTGAMALAFGKVQVTPTSFLLDKRGAIAQRFVGAPDLPTLHRKIEALLAEPPTARA